ncbi:MAG: sodium-dependent transporter [Salinisphaeraceae bacterium]|nr:sodium-dependent transporter [Salinisphaeraceae bacterium]
MIERESPHGTWSSPRAFVIAVAAAAIGLGNVWRMPYLMGEYGGSAFLLVYILVLILVVMPMMVTEMMIGHWGRRSVVRSVRLLSLEAGVHPAWRHLGWLALAGAVLVLSYYSVIAGWSMAYLMRAAGGVFRDATPEQVQAVFSGLVGDAERSLAWHTVFMVAATILVTHGLRKGIEPATRLFLPTAFLSILVLMIMVAWSGQMGTALRWMFTPDFSALGWRGVIEALTQAFFSLSLGMGVVLALSVMLPERISFVQLAARITLLDTLFALFAGMAVYGLVFAVTDTPTSGVRLLFVTLPLATGSTMSSVGLVMFYLAVVLVAITSAVGLMEPMVQWLMERYEISRVFAATSTGLLIWFIGLGTLCSFNVLTDLTFWGRDFYEWLALITGQVLLPLVGVLLCVFVGRLLPEKLLHQAWADSTPAFYRTWYWCMRYPARIGLIIVLLHATGLLEALVGLWWPAGL